MEVATLIVLMILEMHDEDSYKWTAMTVTSEAV